MNNVNQTVRIDEDDKADLTDKVKSFKRMFTESGIINDNCLEIISMIPDQSVNLLILDPPYNKTQSYNSYKHWAKADIDYYDYIDEIIGSLAPKLASNASIYACIDWQSSGIIQMVLSKYFMIRNRITWGRENGRGTKDNLIQNWRSSSEDIWYATVSKNDYVFNGEAIKITKRITGSDKTKLICSNNFWSDLTVPFFGMRENTIHPTQKPEKLLAKLILASTNEDDLILDPFLGSGTTLSVAEKLKRRCIGIEIDEEYCLIAAKRWQNAKTDKRIQGYECSVFMDRGMSFQN